MAYHHGNLRQALIDAAVELVREHGPDAVSVRQVARRAGVSSGAPFRHFADKTELMGAVAEDGVQRLMAQQAARVADAENDPAQHFRAAGIAYVLFAVRHPAHFRVMSRPEYATENVREAWRAGREGMRQIIVQAQEQGSVRAGDPETILITAHALVYGLARLFVDGLFEMDGITEDRAAEIVDRVTNQAGLGIGGDGDADR